MKRRTLITGAAALPLLPVSALAQPADPAIAAHREWLAAYNTNEAFLATGEEGDTPGGAGDV